MPEGVVIIAGSLTYYASLGAGSIGGGNINALSWTCRKDTCASDDWASPMTSGSAVGFVGLSTLIVVSLSNIMM